jgi:DUF2958 family protein
MAWRPTQYLLEGELDNTIPGKVTGWMRFASMKGKVTFDLSGDFHRDIRGAKIQFIGDGKKMDPEAASYMEGFANRQTGKVGDITAGQMPKDYVNYPYIEWYGDDNGRVVLELEAGQVKVIGQPMPWMESYPVSREQQAQNMAGFLGQTARELDLPTDRAICIGMNATGPKQPCGRPGDRGHGMELMTEEIRRQLPPLYGQDGKGGNAIAQVKYFTPDSSWTWYATEFSPQEGLFFGLVDGQCKELGYFALSELESATGPMGLHIERDLHWKPKTLAEIAPELFVGESREGGEDS